MSTGEPASRTRRNNNRCSNNRCNNRQRLRRHTRRRYNRSSQRPDGQPRFQHSVLAALLPRRSFHQATPLSNNSIYSRVRGLDRKLDRLTPDPPSSLTLVRPGDLNHRAARVQTCPSG